MNFLFGFEGRIGRALWWLSQISCMILAVITVIALYKINGMNFERSQLGADMATMLAEGSRESRVTGFVGFGLSLWISLASTIKRFHDHNQSGLWILTSLIVIPFDDLWICVGQIWVLVQCGLRPGTAETNRFGDPGSAFAPEEIAVFQSEKDKKAQPGMSVKRLKFMLHGSAADRDGAREEPKEEPTELLQPTGFGRRGNNRRKLPFLGQSGS